MELELLEKNLTKYGDSNDIPSLKMVLSKATDNELINLIERRVNNVNFSTLWNYIIGAFTNIPADHNRILTIILSLLKRLQSSERSSSSSSSSTTLIQQISIDLIQLKTEHLVELCDYYLNLIQSNQTESDKCFWKDLLPNLLQTLSERDTVTFNEQECNGHEFKANFINTLCLINWSPDIIIPLTMMFIDISLAKDEHSKILNKLTSYIEKIKPQEIPPFVYQLLKLCRHSSARILFLKLLYYFDSQIYSKSFSQQQEVNQLQDIIENAEDHDALDIESTVLFYIQNAAAIGHKCIKDYLASLKNCTKSPEFILHPFQILALFSIASVHQYEEPCFDIIRQSIVAYYNGEIKRKKSIWYRDLINSACEPDKVLSQVICLGEREFLVEPLVNFGYSLLNVGSLLGRDLIAEKQWKLGKMILLKIIKRKRHTSSVILKTFCNHIITKQSASQYIQCLNILTKTTPLLVLQNESCISELLDSLIQSGLSDNNHSDQLLDSLLPLTRVSSTIQDQFILVLRKSLYSRSIDTRKMAVNGFIKLISTLKLTNKNIILSGSSSSCQSFHSGYSLYTQISLSRGQSQSQANTLGGTRRSSEAMFLEILNILKRCFTQQAEVRSVLYKNLCEVVCVNHELGIPILDMTWYQLVEYYVIDPDIKPPINFEKITKLGETECILIEPLGQFIFSISMIILHVNNQSEENGDHSTILKYMNILDSLSNRMATSELTDFDMNDKSDLLSVSAENQQKLHILKEAILICEALIGYKIVAWTNQNRNQGKIINRLFEAYSRFVYYGKNLQKSKKPSSKKIASTNSAKASQQNLTGRNNDQTATGSQLSKLSFQIPSTVLNFNVVERALKILLESSVPWLLPDETNIIKSNTNLHLYFIQAAITLVNKLKSQKVSDVNYQKHSLEYISSIGETIFNAVILKFTNYIEFDCDSALAALDCFHTILVLMNRQLESNLITVLSKIAQKSSDLNLTEYLEPIIEAFQNLLEHDITKLCSDTDIQKRIYSLIINNLNVLYVLIPAGSNSLLNKGYDWLKNFAYTNTISSKVPGIFMDLLFPTHLKCKSGLSVFESVSASINKFMGILMNESFEESREESLNFISLSTVNPLILSLCTCMKLILEEVDYVIGRMKCDYCIICYPGTKNVEKKLEDLRTKEKGVCMQLCFVLNVLSNLSSIMSPPGNVSDAIFKCLLQFYASLSALTKYFISRSSKDNVAFHGSWFEKLIKKAGKQLTPLVYKFISYIGESQSGADCDGSTQGDSTQQQKKRKKSSPAGAPATRKNKILKETRILPKVIYEIEQLSRFLIQLMKKTSVDLSKYIGTGIVRDFRIVQLKETLEQAGAIENSEESDMSDDNEETPAPPTKKLKR